jgi:CheY-like chemotaxis protein/HPt (histidine-containing phosphotransfer) domain-containing protein
MLTKKKRNTKLSHPFILVAEDNPVNRQVMSLLFKSLDMLVEFASNGREALEHFAAGRHRLILMDIQMPEMDGLEAARLIRSNPLISPQPTIIALTAQSEEAHDYYTALGFNDFLEKPLKPAALKSVLNQYLPQNTPPLAESLPKEQPTPPNSTAFDENVLIEMGACLGEDCEEILAKLIDIYLNHTSTLFADITEALIKNDLITIHRAAHTLKSSSANIGLMRLSKLAKQLELWIKPMLSTAPNAQELSKIKAKIAYKVNVMQSAFSRAKSDLNTFQVKLNKGKS